MMLFCVLQGLLDHVFVDRLFKAFYGLTEVCTWVKGNGSLLLDESPCLI